MNEFKSLRFLDLFKSVFRMVGIDYPVMRKILQMKLMMDQRRPPTIMSGSNKKPTGNQFLKSLGVYALYSIVLVPFVFLGDNLMFQMSIIFGIAMFILMTSMISDFSTVLLDVRDKSILHTKPVSTRTVSAAKMMHVLIYMSMLTGAFVAIPSIAILSVHGIMFFLLFLAVLILLVLFIIALTALVYIFILRFFSGERLKDIINYVQILLAVGIIIGYQVLIRSFDFVDMNYTYVFSWWHAFIPPMWFGAPFEMFLGQNQSGAMVGLSLAALLVPMLAIFLYYRLMPSFERNLQKLMEATAKGKKKKKRLENFWAKVVCRKEERVFFRFASIMLKKEREFKLKVYPVLGIAFVFPFIFMFNTLSMGGTFADIAEGKTYYGIYFSAIIVGTVVHTLQASAQYKGSWVFQATPVTAPKSIYSATLKAFLVKLYVPVFLFLSVVFLGIFSVKILPDLLIVLTTVVLFTLLSFKIISKSDYPFSEPFESMQEAGSSVKHFLLMFLVAGFALLHFLASLFTGGLYVYLGILLVVTIFGWRMVFRGRKQVSKA